MTAGPMFWLNRKTLPGSNSRLIAARRSKLSPNERRTRSSPSSPRPGKFR